MSISHGDCARLIKIEREFTVSYYSVSENIYIPLREEIGNGVLVKGLEEN